MIKSGIYNICDNDTLSTNEIVELIFKAKNKKPFILKIPKKIIKIFAKIGDLINMPLNTERLKKITTSFIVSNEKIMKAVKKKLPENSKIGLSNVFEKF